VSIRGLDEIDMGYTLLLAFFVVGLFSAMLLLLEVGRRIGTRHMAVDPEGAKAGHGVIVGVVFSLLSLLLAFTFSGAASRFDARRQLAIQEFNTLNKAYYVVNLFPQPVQAKLKNSFRDYVDAELQAIKALPDQDTAELAYSRASALKLDIQNQVIAVCQDPSSQALGAYVLLPAVNDWIANSTNRVAATNTHPPVAIYVVLIGLALVSSWIAGYAMAEAKARSWLHVVGFAAVVTVIIYFIIDLELPRVGLIRVTDTDRLLVELRNKMG
jgi:Protein of unknown function (DUF4239)